MLSAGWEKKDKHQEDMNRHSLFYFLFFIFSDGAMINVMIARM